MPRTFYAEFLAPSDDTPAHFVYAGRIYTTTVGHVKSWLDDPGIDDQAFLDGCKSSIPDDGRKGIRLFEKADRGTGDLIVAGYR